MHKQPNNQPEQPAFKLSGNNSIITLADGTIYQLNIEAAFLNFLDTLPKEIKLEDLRQELLGINDHLTTTLPDDACVPIYKSMHFQINAYAAFFDSLLLKVKGGNND